MPDKDPVPALPSGPYLGRVESLGGLYVSSTGSHYRVADVRWVWEDLKPTDLVLPWMIVNHPKARWTWDGAATDFFCLEEMIGKLFVFRVHLYQGPSSASPYNKILDAICEVVE